MFLCRGPQFQISVEARQAKPILMSDILLTQGMIDKAIREALNDFDKWVDVTGHVKMFSSTYHELQGLVEDAVLVGIQMASVGQVSRRSDGTLILPTK